MTGRSAILVLLLCGCTPTAPETSSVNPAAAGDLDTRLSPEPTHDEATAGHVAWPPLQGREPIVLDFPEGAAEITADVARTLDEAVRTNRGSGNVWLRFGPGGDAPALSAERARSVRAYLDRRRIRSVPLLLRAGTIEPERWESAEGEFAGVALLGATAAFSGRIDVPPTANGHHAAGNGHADGDPPAPGRVPLEPGRVLAVQERQGALALATRSGGPTGRFAALSGWLTATGTLTERALALMAAECGRLEGSLTADCQAAVAAQEGEFGSAPAGAREEFSFLLTACRTARQGTTCAEAIALEREFRALPRGRLRPEPLTMEEGVEVTFTAKIFYEGDRAGGGRPGVPIGQSQPAGEGGSAPTIIPISSRMCFTLRGAPGDFRISPAGNGCPEINESGGSLKYAPEWRVTPLRAGRLELKLATELYVNGIKREYRHDPYPLMIDVKPKKSRWDKLDEALERATGTVKLGTLLAQALGGLFAAIMAWGCWTWFRRPQPPVPTS